MRADWIRADDGGVVQVDDQGEVLAEVFYDDDEGAEEGSWFWWANAPGAPPWALECADADEGRAMCEAVLRTAGLLDDQQVPIWS